MRDAIRHGEPSHSEGFFQVFWAVIHTGQKMAMQVKVCSQGCHVEVADRVNLSYVRREYIDCQFQDNALTPALFRYVCSFHKQQYSREVLFFSTRAR